MPMAFTPQPTLWRTCRVLANRKRLRILAHLARQPSQTVSSAARHMKLSLPTASQYLRALEARGLLTCRRVGPRVEYCLADGRSEGAAKQLVAALRLVLGRGGDRFERVFKSATAFTHPRRVEIFRTIAKGADSFAKIQAATRISVPALQRQLEKLEARGFIASTRGAYAVRLQTEPFARALARLATV
jgi:DNA-binding transcriptional ArsR family regulator